MKTQLQRLYKQLDKLLKSDLAVLTKEAKPLVYDIKDYTKDIQELKTLINRIENPTIQDKIDSGEFRIVDYDINDEQPY